MSVDASPNPPSCSPTRTLERRGPHARLFEVACRAGRRDRPYPETHDAWTIALVRRGTFAYRAADTNRVHALRPGWMLLGRHGQEYECSHDHDGGDDCMALEVSPALVEDIARATPGCRGAVMPTPVLAPVPRVAALIELALGAPDVDEAAYDVTAALVAHVHGARRVLADDGAITRAHRARVDAAIALIEARSHESLALATLADAAGLSPFHFLRVFRKTTGTTPHQYVVGARLRHAARLLAETARPVTQIAYDVGFSDLSNFVRTFHRTVGRSPRAFRSRVARSRR